MKQKGRVLPPLDLPTVQLYGKDSPKGTQDLLITAQALLGVLSRGQNGNASEISTVSLIDSVSLPSQKGCMLRAKVLSPVDSGKDLLFEPDNNLLTPLGIDPYESVVYNCFCNY